VYWAIASSYVIVGAHDWVARIPIALSAIALCWLTMAFGAWAFGKRAGFYAGLCMATCVGLFLFTRILIPDVMLTFTVACAMWAFLRALDEEEPHPRFWAFALAVNLGLGLLLKSLIGILFPLAAMTIYLGVTCQLFSGAVWRRLHPFSGLLIVLLIAAPWHVLATLRNPPYFAFTLHSGPGEYHGFFWFFFINEQLLRFLNLRYPRDYSTVPRLYFWVLHLVWLFPWSVYFPAVAKLSFKPVDRAGRTRLLALCWAGFVLVFFTFSTTQEYYSMPCYPALALLLGSAMATQRGWIRRGTRSLSVIAACTALVTLALFFLTRNAPAPGDISQALSQHPGAYTLSLGHMQDLTLASFAYLRTPLLVAAIAFCIGARASWKWTGMPAFLSAAFMMILFFHAARLAMAVFDPYLSSRPLAEAILKSPEGTLNNFDYGSFAPGAPDVFVTDQGFRDLWLRTQRVYVVAQRSAWPRLEGLVGSAAVNLVAEKGGKMLLTNHPLTPQQAR
jgi:4-amino-4-deoxy-L-arabinose transferase-like glycosyltransferase